MQFRYRTMIRRCVVLLFLTRDYLGAASRACNHDNAIVRALTVNARRWTFENVNLADFLCIEHVEKRRGDFMAVEQEQRRRPRWANKS